jgi:hypothetical protein
MLFEGPKEEPVDGESVKDLGWLPEERKKDYIHPALRAR